MKIKDLALIALFAAIISVLAQIAIPLPFTPVPITGQVLGVFLTGALLGTRGGWAVLVYLLLGALGLPVFAQAKGGLAVLVGPTGGYLWGFALGTFLQGFILERWCRGKEPSPWLMGFSMLASLALIYLLGVLWLKQVVHLDLRKAFLVGALPFLPLDLVKLFLAVALALPLRRTLKQGGFI
ncbi:MAG TPA: biotin transporter BioY [Moorella mulderi]|nr:biotin transporter BioY [Moorella mulderi]